MASSIMKKGFYVSNYRRVNGGKVQKVQTKFALIKGDRFILPKEEGYFLEYPIFGRDFQMAILGHWVYDEDNSYDGNTIEYALMAE